MLPKCCQSYPHAGSLSSVMGSRFAAEALEREGGRRLRALFEIEYAPADMRAGLRADNSPLSVAFSEPRLRADGLAGDTIGDAAAFFGISEKTIHSIVCFCHSGETMSAETAAARVRFAAAREGEGEPLRVSRFFGALWRR